VSTLTRQGSQMDGFSVLNLDDLLDVEIRGCASGPGKVKEGGGGASV